MLGRLRSFGVCGTPLRIFYDTVVALAIFHAVVCRGGGSMERDRKRLNKLFKKARSLASIEEVGEGRVLSKPSSILGSSFSHN